MTMERLTKRWGNCVSVYGACQRIGCDCDCDSCQIDKVFQRLADYEDLGTVDHLRELVEAEAALETRKGGDKG